MRESTIEQRISKKLQSAGWMSVKCMQMSMNGWPDRQYLKAPARIVFVEWKRPGEVVDPDGLQALRHRQLREMGFEVIVAWSEEQVKHLFF